MKRKFPTAEPFLPDRLSIPSMEKAAQKCKGCDLYKHATQAVFGEGKRTARALLIGEQPGDKEDLAGKPFVGPAGKLLDKALELAGFSREEVYITNAVKHFKFEERGKRRLHKRPSASQVGACRPWLESEIKVINPNILVCLGATAAQSFMGKAFRLTKERGKLLKSPEGQRILVTIHPSALLRLPPNADREAEFKKFVKDLMKARKLSLT